ncbi:MAG TPA: GNAT family N-acetyltransferase [Acidimicrobiia bacterium]|jgi:GNAT superfamily N-acetyltransferase|nr:GNAT family N-acetyltransferase [Acidimicrobiia bacterium]
MLIRPVVPGDLDALYEVCLRTGHAGEDASDRFADPRLLGEVYVGPYLMMPSGIGFTAVDNGVPSGYVLAAVDTRRFEAECESDWWPALRARYPRPLAEDPSMDDAEIVALIHDPESPSDDLVARYPAHLHIDLLPVLQGKGVGRAMMSRLLEDLRAKGVPGVHLGVDARNLRAVGFYEHLGFEHLDDTDDVVMGIRLDEG